jgi:hypothetical protein
MLVTVATRPDPYDHRPGACGQSCRLGVAAITNNGTDRSGDVTW